jgi:mono/diheme cytochrome c family protein
MKSAFGLLALAAVTLASFAPNRVSDRGTAFVSEPARPTGSPAAKAFAGRALFLKNCAHCHGADAHGDEGPDLHNLDWTDEQITQRIRNGRKGQMTAFAGKLSPDKISEVIAYLRTLK